MESKVRQQMKRRHRQGQCEQLLMRTLRANGGNGNGTAQSEPDQGGARLELVKDEQRLKPKSFPTAGEGSVLILQRMGSNAHGHEVELEAPFEYTASRNSTILADCCMGKTVGEAIFTKDYPPQTPASQRHWYVIKSIVEDDGTIELGTRPSTSHDEEYLTGLS